MTDDFDDDDGGVWSVCLKGCARVCARVFALSLSLSLFGGSSMYSAMCVCARMKEVYIFCRYIYSMRSMKFQFFISNVFSFRFQFESEDKRAHDFEAYSNKMSFFQTERRRRCGCCFSKKRTHHHHRRRE